MMITIFLKNETFNKKSSRYHMKMKKLVIFVKEKKDCKVRDHFHYTGE